MMHTRGWAQGLGHGPWRLVARMLALLQTTRADPLEVSSGWVGVLYHAGALHPLAPWEVAGGLLMVMQAMGPLRGTRWRLWANLLAILHWSAAACLAFYGPSPCGGVPLVFVGLALMSAWAYIRVPHAGR